MATYTPNLKLKKPSTGEYYDMIADLNDTKDKIDAEISESAVSINKYGNVLVTDWKNLIASAALEAATNGCNAIKFRKGTYYTSGPLPEDVHIFGAGKGETIIDFGITSGFALTLKKYYTRPIKIRDLTLLLHDINQDAGGICVSNSGVWGVGADIKNVEVMNFTTSQIYMRGAFEANFENVNCYSDKRGSAYVNTILDIGGNDANSLSNVNSFKNCTFHGGRIGIKVKGAMGTTFDSCAFESLDLFYNSELLTGVSAWSFFKHCWFEVITRGIINAKINLTTLDPILPIEGKTNLELVRMTDNLISSGLPVDFVNSTVEPVLYASFTPKDGLNLGQVSFPTVQNPSTNPNTLDDYEEGVWTPGITFGNANVGLTYSSQNGTYTKIGNRVFLSAKINLSAKGSSVGSALITGLPFLSDGLSAVTLHLYNITFANVFQGYVDGTNVVLSEIAESGVQTLLNDTNFANDSEIILSASYKF